MEANLFLISFVAGGFRGPKKTACQLRKTQSRWAHSRETHLANTLTKTHYLTLSDSPKKSPARLQNLYSIGSISDRRLQSFQQLNANTKNRKSVAGNVAVT
jgi:hypothetical protein